MSKITFAAGAAFGEFEQPDGDAIVLAYLTMSPEGLAFMWLPALFLAPAALTPDLRKDLVAMLRHHADKLETGEADRRMRELMPEKTGQW